jgi:hypothetical protein
MREGARPLLSELTHTTWSEREPSLAAVIGLYGTAGFVLCVTDYVPLVTIRARSDTGARASTPQTSAPYGVPKLCSQRAIIPICRRNRVLTPDTDHAEKPRG